MTRRDRQKLTSLLSNAWLLLFDQVSSQVKKSLQQAEVETELNV